jgi:hypothetical protein
MYDLSNYKKVKMIKMKKLSFKNLFISTFIAGIILATPACWQRYNIHKVKDLHLLEQEIPALDEHSLVIFDIDETLIEAENLFCSNVNKKAKSIWYPLYEKARKEISSRDKQRILWRRAAMALESTLIDVKVLQLIEQIKKQKTKVCALTKCSTGKREEQKSLEESRFDDLKKLGIDFRTSFPEHELFTLSELVTEDSVPMFYKGILLTAHSTKGKTLTAFLNTIHWWPKRIIFVDDKIENLEDVALVAKEKNIPFLGLHYLAAEDMPCDVDPKVAAFQIDYLMEHEQWINEDEAKEEMIK